MRKSLYLLKLTDVCKLELAKFMFALQNDRSPNIFKIRSLNWSRYTTVAPGYLQKMVILSPQLTKIYVKTLYHLGEGVYGEK